MCGLRGFPSRDGLLDLSTLARGRFRESALRRLFVDPAFPTAP